MGTHYIVGVDEVGRGALAGPVVVATVCVPRGLRLVNFKLGKLKDSKKLTPRQRGKWFEYFRNNPDINYALARVYPRTIERINISAAANLAAARAYKRLRATSAKHRVCLDGGLFLGNGAQPRNARTIIKGDEKIRAIAAASIVAKVSRDRAMVRLAKKYPAYGFEKHKGYGTKKHFTALKRWGLSEAHRKSFCR